MGLIPDQEHLTTTDPAFESTRRSTFPGMAHFARTGPEGRTCRECVLWNGCGEPVHYYARKGLYGGTIKPRSCAKHRELMSGEIGTPVPHNAGACKYFSENPEPPAITQRR